MKKLNLAFPVFLFVVGLLCFYVSRPRAQLLGPTDQIQSMAPFNGPAPDRPWDVLQADGVLQFQPWRKLVLESWGRFEVPGWNPYQLCGTPLLANSQSGGFYPPHIVLGVLHVPVGIAMMLLVAGHFALAAAGVFALCRSLRATPVGAGLAAMGFTFSAFMLSWAALPSVISTVAWMPWLLLSVVRAVEKPAMKHGVNLAACVGMMLLAGHLQFAAYGLLAAAFVGLVLALVERKWLGLAWIFFGTVLGIGLAMPQILPVLEYSKNSHRKTVASEEGYAAYKASATQGYELAGWLFPSLLGNPDKAAQVQGLPDGVADFWPVGVKRGANFAESAMGLGIVLVGALALARLKGRKKLFALGGTLCALGLFLAMPTALNKLAYFNLPSWSSTGSPGRAGVLFLLGGAVIVSSLSLGRIRKPALVGVALLLPVAAAFLFVGLPPEAVQGWAKFNPWVVLSVVVAAGLYLGRGLIGQIGPISPIRPISTVAAATFALALGLCLRSPVLPPQPDIQRSPERVAWLNNRWDLYRTPKATMPGNLSSFYGIRDAAGYDSLLHTETVKMLDEANSTPSAPPENGNMMFLRSSATPASLAELGVTKVYSPDPNWAGQTGKPFGDRLTEFTIPGKGRFSKQVLTSKDSPGLISFKTILPDRLTIRERAMRGWTMTVNGKTNDLPEGRWIELPSLPADTAVTLRYTPPGLKTGLIIGGFCLALLLGLGFLSERLASKDALKG